MKGIKINWKAIPDVFKLIGKYGKEHAPSILVGLGVIGLGATVYFTADAAPKAKKALEHEEDVRSENGDPKMKFIDKVKVAGPYYIPAGVAAGFTVGCNLAAQKINLSRLSSLGVMYAVARNDLKEVKDKIIETDGQKKMDGIDYQISKDSLTSINFDNLYDTGCGDLIVVDKYFKRGFLTSPTVLGDALTTLNNGLKTEGEYSLNDFLYELKVPWSNSNAAKMANFVETATDGCIYSYQIYKYINSDDSDPLACIFKDQKICVLDYSQLICPTYDVMARMPRFE